MRKTMRDVEAVTSAQLRTMTEPEIDDLFYAAWTHRHGLFMELFRDRSRLLKAAGAKRLLGGGWDMRESEAADLAEAAARKDPEGVLAKAKSVVDMTNAAIDTLMSGPIALLQAEEDRRGGWTRAYLAVTNGKGHVHNTRNCRTCHNGETPTLLHWMTEYSGKSEAEIIRAAGERACSVCYPHAPTEDRARPSLMFSDEEIQAAEARRVRDEAKAKKAADKAAKAITDADGGPLKVYTWTRKAHQKIVGGKTVDVPAMDFHEELKTLYAARLWLADRFDSWRSTNGPEAHRDLHKVADAVALKEGKTREEVLKEAEQRSARRK